MNFGKVADRITEIFISIILIALVFLLGQILENTGGIEQLLAGVGIVIVIAVGNALVVGFLLQSWNKDRLELFQHEVRLELESFKKFILPKDTQYLLSGSDVNQVEKNTEGDQIWIISPNLANDTGGDLMVDVTASIVKHNIRRGIQYVFIYPDTEEIIGRLPELRDLFYEKSDRLVECVVVVYPQFFRVTITQAARLTGRA